MVDVGDKPVTRRRAVAGGLVVMHPDTLTLALGAGGPKGPVLDVARVAGILAAKRTAELVPLCHTLPVDAVDVEFFADGPEALAIRATVTTTGRTGVEMEALTAVSVAALTVIDMLKAVQKDLTITDVGLLEKTGGRSGAWTRGR